MLDKTLDDRLDALLASFRELLGETFPRTKATDLMLFGLTLDEATDWLENLPSFPKQISSALNSKRPPDKLAVYLYGGVGRAFLIST